MSSSEESADQKLESILSEVVSNITPLTEHKITFPANPYETKPEYIEKITQAHEIIEKIKQGAEVILISVDQNSRNKTTVFSVNMEPEEAILRLSVASNRFAKLILRKEAQRRKGISE